MAFRTITHEYIAAEKKIKSLLKVLPQHIFMLFSVMLFTGIAGAQTTTIATGALVTVAAATTATTPGSMVIDPGGSVNNSGNLLLQGNWTNNGTYTDVTGTVTFNAVTPGKTINGLLTGTNRFNNLVFNGAGGTWTFTNNAEAGGNIFFTNGAVTAPAVLTLDGNLTQTGASFAHNNGLVVFKGSVAQSYTATTPLIFFSVTNNNSFGLPGLSLNSDLTILKELKLISLSKFNLVSGNVTLRSTAANTANLAAVPAETNIIKYGTGRFIVERYINAGTSAGQHGKSWQFLAAPAIGQTIHQAWMEGASANANPKPGYGTQIPGTTGTAGGFDVTSTTQSIETYIPVSNTWLQAGNPTTTAINNSQGYMVFVRGDRSVINFSGANSTALPTTLRTTGTLQTGPVMSLLVTAGLFQSVGNPYPSAVDFSTMTRTGGVDPNFYLYDPTLYGSRGYGGYQTITAATGYLATPGNFSTTSTIYNTTSDYRNIQSGQAFFIRATGTNGTLNFAETDKVSGSALVNRVTARAGQLSMLSTNLLVENGNSEELADGNKVVFDNKYSNGVDKYDAVKIMNKGENAGISSNGNILAVEARKRINNNDTIRYNMASLRTMDYKLMFIPQNLQRSNLTAALIDKYLDKKTTVSLSDTSYININVTSDPGSKATDRFMLVFTDRQYNIPVTHDISAVNNKAAPVNDAGYVSVYPNPVKDRNIQVAFIGQRSGKYSLKLVDYAGRVLYKSSVNVTGREYIYSIKLSPAEPAGIYKLSIASQTGITTTNQIIIQ